MAIATVPTAFNIDIEFELAGFGKRFLAIATDALLLSLIMYAAYMVLDAMNFKLHELEASVEMLLILIPAFLYHLIFEILMNGQSPGKKIVGIKVISMTGSNPSISQYLIRWSLGLGNYIFFSIPYIILLIFYNPLIFFPIVIVLAFFYLPDLICAGVSKKSQRLGDIAAGTLVIDIKKKMSINDTIFLDLEPSEYVPVFPQVMRLTDKDISGIHSLINQNQKKGEVADYTIRVAQRIKEVLEIESDLYPIDFLKQLIVDYNHISQKS